MLYLLITIAILAGVAIYFALQQKSRLDEVIVSLDNGFENSMMPLLHLDIDNGDIISGNKEARNFFGVSGNSLTGNNLSKLIPGFKFDEMRETLLNRDKPRLYEYEISIDDNEQKTIQLYPCYFRLNREKCFYLNILDITHERFLEQKLREAEEAVKSAERAKHHFLSNISHEIRTPMNAILGMSTLLLDTNLDEEQRDYASTAKMATNSLLTIVNNVLELSRIENGKIDIIKKEFDFREMIDEVVELFYPKAMQKKLELEAVTGSRIPPLVSGDKKKIQKIIINLVDNAIKFTESGYVYIKSELADYSNGVFTLAVKVEDSGIGISDRQRESIFTSFAQADASSTRKYGGMGVGLTLSKALVNLIKGSIHLESKVGEGSRFWFDLQLGEVESSIKSSFSTPFEDQSVVFLSENHIVIEAVRSIALYDGFEFECYAHSEEIEHFLSMDRDDYKQIGCIVIDINCEAIVLLNNLKEDGILNGTKIVLLLDYNLDLRDQNKWNIDFDSYITRPITGPKLTHTLDRLANPVKEGSWVADAESTSQISHEKKSINILVAEDNVVNQVAILKILEKRGYKADLAKNGEEAVLMMETKFYDLVFMDIQMPGLNGMQAARIVRNKSSAVKNHKIPIIALTAHAMPGDREQFLKSGMNDYISKPVNPSELEEAIRKNIEDPVNNLDHSDSEILNIREFLDRLDGDMELGQELIDYFLEDTKQKIEELGDAFKDKDFQQMRFIAHAIKGASINISAYKINEVSKQLEDTAREEEYNISGELIGELGLLFKEFEIYIAKVFN